jgi:hypothetical protein
MAGGIRGGVIAGAAIGSLPAVWDIAEVANVYAVKKRPSVGRSGRALLSASTFTTTRKLLDSNVEAVHENPLNNAEPDQLEDYRISTTLQRGTAEIVYGVTQGEKRQ